MVRFALTPAVWVEKGIYLEPEGDVQAGGGNAYGGEDGWSRKEAVT